MNSEIEMFQIKEKCEREAFYNQLKLIKSDYEKRLTEQRKSYESKLENEKKSNEFFQKKINFLEDLSQSSTKTCKEVTIVTDQEIELRDKLEEKDKQIFSLKNRITALST